MSQIKKAEFQTNNVIYCKSKSHKFFIVDRKIQKIDKM